MNLKNLMMWGIIVLLVAGLFQLFQNPKNSTVSDKMPFSEFLKNIDDGRVVQVEIKGNNIEGILSDGTVFNTYTPNDPNLVEKLTSKGVTITASPLEDKMPSLIGVLLSWFPMLLLIGVWIFFMRQMQGGKGGAMGFGRSKAKLMNEVKGKITFNDKASSTDQKGSSQIAKASTTQMNSAEVQAIASNASQKASLNGSAGQSNKATGDGNDSATAGTTSGGGTGSGGI